jgi:hypothetical protein
MGPGVFQPVYGETFTDIKNSVQVPVNYYMVVEDANDPTNPVSHIRGPLKFYPEPFQTLIEDRNTGKPYFRCIEVSNEKGKLKAHIIDCTYVCICMCVCVYVCMCVCVYVVVHALSMWNIMNLSSTYRNNLCA